jgi:carbamoyltransferase
MHILGINAYHGDVAAVLLRDGQLVAALEEERFRRVKHWAGFPTQAIRRCLEMGGVDGGSIEAIGVSRDPRANLVRKGLFALRHRPSPRLLKDRLRNRRVIGNLEHPLAEALGIERERLPRVHNVEHHPSHLASAFLVSPFDDASVCSIDGFGDFVSTSMALGRANQVKVLQREYFPHSLGMLYTAVTQWLGFLGYGDEFKVMGLAPYGSPSHVAEIRQLVQLKRGGRFALDLRYFRHWREGVDMTWEDGYPTLGQVYTQELERLLGPARKPDEALTSRHEDIARSLQAVYEECAFHVLNALWEKTRNPRLALAGGCAMNSVANGRVRENTPFREVYIQPAAGDNGTALGAAYHVWHAALGKPRSFVMRHGYWGTEYPDAGDVDVDLQDTEDWTYTSTRFADEGELCRDVAKLLAEGNVVGWYQGRMEWGARALGNRSILADPRRADMRDLINTKIKFREKFRPFAPSILEDRLDEYFVGGAPDPFMQQVYPVRLEKRSVVPAITHVDGSGRLQTVSAVTNPRYYRLIQEFDRITGVPLVLNTSFNENEPIVDTPMQAFDCFRRTRMDVIVLGNRMIRRLPAATARSSNSVVAKAATR